jgi:diguanylate cyclase (GGDEF)-like protein
MRVADVRNFRPAAESAAARSRSGGTPASSDSAVVDTATILGVPANELTPRAREAIMQLLAEVDRLRRDLEHSKQKIRELADQADKDVLLPVYNRRAFVRELTRTLTYAERHEVNAALVYFDLDRFKSVNDAQGHAAGDAALARVADLLLASVRQSDIVGRLGGDEFGAILLNSTADDATAKATTVATRVGDEVGMKISYGVYPLKGGEEPAAALAAADRAMYEQKRHKT